MLRQLAVPLCLVVPAPSSRAAVPGIPVPVAFPIAGVFLPVFHNNCTDPLTPQAGPHGFFGSDVFRENQIH